jgi:multidrug efflux pump subunit AcrA (membrane-fusion protein)
MTMINIKLPHSRTCFRVVLTLGLCASLLQACTSTTPEAPKHEEEAEAEHHVSLPTMRVITMPVQKHLTFPGKVIALPDHSVSVTPNIAGKITRVLVVPGQKVSKGQLIALLDDQQLVAQGVVVETAGDVEPTAEALAVLYLAHGLFEASYEFRL